MKITIKYCVMWDYKPYASRAEAELKNSFPTAQVSLIEGGGGVFDVNVDGDLLYSKRELHNGKFPKEGQLTTLINNAKANKK